MMEINYGVEKNPIYKKKKNSKEIESFAFMVAHDLRLPLHNINGCANELKDGYTSGLDDKGRFLVNTIAGQCELMANLIKDFLAFSQLNYQDANKESVNMDTLVHLVAQEQSALNPQRKIVFNIAPM